MTNKSYSLPNWRSVLFVPAHVERFVQSAHTRHADAIQLDLEDSVPMANKETARKLLLRHSQYLATKGCDVIVRVNRDLRNCVLDLQAAIVPEVTAISLPKAMGPEHIRLIDELITELEINQGMPIGQVRLIAMIETLEGLANVNAIAGSCSRIEGLALGTEDLSLEGGFEPTEQNLFLPAQQLVFAAKKHQIRVYGFPASIADYSDMDVFQNRIEKSKAMGFDGAWCVHPVQVIAVNEVYQTMPEELEKAKLIITAYDDAIKHHRAAVELNGKMIDLPVVERARRLLNR
ncbi:MAG: HpcH/HpaI aldolase/citrate lyase family protein [Arenicella sp.]